jgi:hypothetical protein
MKIMDYVVCMLLSTCFTLLFLYPRISENKAAWETQRQFNEKVIEALSGLVETDHVIIEQLTTKKPGH